MLRLFNMTATQPAAIPVADSSDSYNQDSRENGWDSPERAQRLVEQYITDGSVVLDVGIGTGQAVRGYAEKGATVIGLDHDPGMLAKAQEVTGKAGMMKKADINEQWPVGEAKADVVQMVGVIEFANDIWHVINQAKRSLKPNGVFVFTVEAPSSPDDNLTQYYPDANLTVYRHTADEVRELLSNTGLALLYDESYGGYKRGDVTGKVPYHIFLAQNKQTS